MRSKTKQPPALWRMSCLFVILGASACQSLSAPITNAQQTTSAVTAESVTDTSLAQEWYLVGAVSVDRRYHNATPPIRMDLRHLPMVYVYAGCNHLNFQWQASDGHQRMTISEGASTLKVCDNMMGDQLVTTYLPKMSGYAFEGTQTLVLASVEGSELIFSNRTALERLGMAEQFGLSQ